MKNEIKEPNMTLLDGMPVVWTLYSIPSMFWVYSDMVSRFLGRDAKPLLENMIQNGILQESKSGANGIMFSQEGAPVWEGNSGGGVEQIANPKEVLRQLYLAIQALELGKVYAQPILEFNWGSFDYLSNSRNFSLMASSVFVYPFLVVASRTDSNDLHLLANVIKHGRVLRGGQ